MQLFFHDVGMKGADADFPKTIYKSIPIEEILKHSPVELDDEMSRTFSKEFPSGKCNVWGVPQGASSVIRQLSVGDAMLLVRSTGGRAEIPALCQVRAFWKVEMSSLSQRLWGSKHFPYVFFFETEEIDLTWPKFKQDVGYMPNFRPSGNVYRIREDRLEPYGGVEGYVNSLRPKGKQGSAEPGGVAEPSPQYLFHEGQKLLKEAEYFSRNKKLVDAAKKHHGLTCQACGFEFKLAYGELGSGYIECHHLKPLSDSVDPVQTSLDDVRMLCSNCHRMVHRKTPPLSIEELQQIVHNNSLQARRP